MSAAQPKGRERASRHDTRNAVRRLARAVRGLTDAQRANTDKLNEILREVRRLSGRDHLDLSDLDRSLRKMDGR